MRKEEYIREQINASEWTRQNKNNMALTKDTVREFAKYIDYTTNILEIGCGDGFALDVLKNLGFREVTGCDLNLEKVSVAVENGHSASVQDAHTLGFKDGCFDAVYCSHTLEHTFDAALALREIRRVLAPGGLLFIVVPDHARIYGEVDEIADFIPNLEHRELDYFEKLAERHSGNWSDSYRNQYPLTMKLLLRKVMEPGFDIQAALRIMRDGPELWVIGTKPKPGQISPDSIIVKNYCKEMTFGKLFRGLIRRIFNNSGNKHFKRKYDISNGLSLR